jgi:hypothetical protein
MAGILRTDTIQNSNTSTIITQTNSTTLTIGTSGQTVTLAAGATSSGFGATYNGAVNWDTTPKTTTVTAASGVGYFINTTSGGVTVNLPAGTAGAIVALSDYAGTWNTNNVTVNANGTEKIGGVASSPASLSTQGQSVTFIYVDSTRGWVNVGDATLVQGNTFVAATGGTITTCGNYKIHTFTGPGTFTVTNTGPGSSTVDYLVVAGGGGGQGGRVGGGGAGGYRESKATGAPWTASPLASSTSLPVSVTAYPITVGAGGNAGTVGVPSPISAGNGNNSIFSTITSAGGGSLSPCGPAGAGGSGRGGTADGPGSAGNTPPVSPPQGNPGGSGNPPGFAAGGGGGAGGAGGNGSGTAGSGGVGVSTSISGSSLAYAGGGAGGASVGFGGTPGSGSPCGTGGGAGVAGTTNRGGGGGSNSSQPCLNGGAGGSGVVVIRYQYR